MKWIGLTGGLASGKSTVARALRAKGYPVVDADDIAKAVVAPGTDGLAAVLQVFGQDLKLPDGTLDRRSLGRRVFGDPIQRERLEALLHPLIQAETAARRQALAEKGTPMAFYDVPLLFEKNLTGFDAVVVVTATESVRRDRMRRRDGWTDQEIDERLASQMPLEQKVQRATYVIENDGSLEDLEHQVDDLLTALG